MVNFTDDLGFCVEELTDLTFRQTLFFAGCLHGPAVYFLQKTFDGQRTMLANLVRVTGWV
jgi:hypothetical protein